MTLFGKYIVLPPKLTTIMTVNWTYCNVSLCVTLSIIKIQNSHNIVRHNLMFVSHITRRCLNYNS